MPLVRTSEKSNLKDMVRPFAWLKHIFLCLRSPINGLEIMYEVSGHKVQGRLVQRGQPVTGIPSSKEGRADEGTSLQRTCHEGLLAKFTRVRWCVVELFFSGGCAMPCVLFLFWQQLLYGQVQRPCWSILFASFLQAARIYRDNSSSIKTNLL
ncbi:hypothetical protein GOP47_0025695 [Adiantum capillus-veneris]|uniref:Uncharacterized protein n=1 Tax=Adiantum capillus-veneris TaxID=13818 RepID=A0A9D4U0L5_ADICA|nr:hypothetical protein GOP47_0025695 [Adiantum capillus-veneris]